MCRCSPLEYEIQYCSKPGCKPEVRISTSEEAVKVVLKGAIERLAPDHQLAPLTALNFLLKEHTEVLESLESHKSHRRMDGKYPLGTGGGPY